MVMILFTYVYLTTFVLPGLVDTPLGGDVQNSGSGSGVLVDLLRKISGLNDADRQVLFDTLQTQHGEL